MNKVFIIKMIGYAKAIVFSLRPHVLFSFLRHPLQFSANLLSLTKWMSEQDTKNIMNDFCTFKRYVLKRYELYKYVVETKKLENEAIDYLEFGVCGGHSFKWFTDANKNSESKFYGFDTFEGLPEKWGMVYKKGDMNAGVPIVNDTRVEFVKGLFQDTLLLFLKQHNLNNGKRKVIHLDADLFSSTIYTLTTLAPYLKKGDILMYDEFNVPNHEFLAHKIFTESFYVKTKLIGAVNNYVQIAMEIV